MDDLLIKENLTIPPLSCISLARADGACGQNVNKVETKVDLRWNPGHRTILAGDERTGLLGRGAPRAKADRRRRIDHLVEPHS